MDKKPYETFDKDPIALYGKGYYVSKNGKDGFVDQRGEIILDYKYKFQQCFMDDAYGVMEGVNEITYLSQLLEKDGYDIGCWTGIVGVQPMYAYDSNTSHGYTVTIIDEQEIIEP